MTEVDISTCASFDLGEEKIIKSKRRVQKHGEVFTPSWMVNKMLDTPDIKEACESLSTTFLEPGPGEGAFLTAILKRKLSMVGAEYSDTIGQYENFSLLALSTLYGIELLEDNTQICSMNLFEVYKSFYKEVAEKHSKRTKRSVLDSAKTIIAKNIVNGNFLTRLTHEGKPIVFPEWKAVNKLSKSTKSIKVIRTEYSLDDVVTKRKNEPGSTWEPPALSQQLELFPDNIQEVLFSPDDLNQDQKPLPKFRYVPAKITNAYKEEMEEYVR